MTKISYIHGIGATDPGEYRDRGKLVPPQNYINYPALTDGELRLTLLADQANMLAAMYPENKELLRSRQILVDALYKGLHNTPLPTGIFTGNLATVISEIRKAQKDTRPAVGAFYGRKNVGRGIGDPLVPLSDCQKEAFVPPHYMDDFKYKACQLQNEYKKILNDKFEKSSHQLLYDFVANPNAVPPVVTVKATNHRLARGTVHTITKISMDNLKLWERNGIIRYNSLAGGVGPRHPEETIQILKENAAMSGIGVVPIAAIILAIAAAITAIAQLVSSFKAKGPDTTALWNQLQGIGTETYGPQLQDWNMDGVIDQQDQVIENQQNNNTGSGLLENDLAIPLLVGGAAYLLLK